MDIAQTLAIFACGIAAGILAALLGVGGGLIMVPLMTMVFGVPLTNATGASLVAGLAASDAAALWPSKRKLMDVDLSWTLALFSTFGGTLGAMVALAIRPEIIKGIFALVLLYSAYQLARPQKRNSAEMPGAHLSPPSRARQAVMMLIGLFAGASSGLLGIGGGVIIVPALALILHKPFKVATATSNLLIGLTALTGAFAYWWRGALLPVPTIPITLGAFGGAIIGSIIDKKISSQVLRASMALLLVYSAYQMAWPLIAARLGL